MTIVSQKRVQKKRKAPLSIRFSAASQEQIENFSRLYKKSKSSLIQEAVDAYIDMQQWQIRGVKKGIQSLDDGKKIDGEEAMNWFNSLGSDHELDIPKLS